MSNSLNKIDVFSNVVEILEAATSEYIYTSYHSGAWHLESNGEVICKHENFLEFLVLCEEHITHSPRGYSNHG